MDKLNYCVIMAGGIGSRFWPLSKTERPKQFLDILGTGRTLLQQRMRCMRTDSMFWNLQPTGSRWLGKM